MFEILQRLSKIHVSMTLFLFDLLLRRYLVSYLFFLFLCFGFTFLGCSLTCCGFVDLHPILFQFVPWDRVNIFEVFVV